MCGFRMRRWRSIFGRQRCISSMRSVIILNRLSGTAKTAQIYASSKRRSSVAPLNPHHAKTITAGTASTRKSTIHVTISQTTTS